jgi:signal transduction histidine kinase
MRFTVCLAFFLLLLSSQTRGQSFTVYNYSVNEGLPSSEVYQVFQDAKGFLWFATDNGVVKFDGTRMEKFHTKDGLTDPVVFSFYEDPKKRLWFRTFSSTLCYMESGIIKRYAYNSKFESQDFDSKGVLDFLVTENDELWFIHGNKFGVIDSAGNINITVLKKHGVFCKTVGKEFLMVRSFYNPIHDSVFIDDQQLNISVAPSNYANQVLRVVRWRDKLYLSMNHDVFEYDGKTLTKFLASDNPVISLSLDKEDNLWVGYLNGGVEQYKAPDPATRWKPDFLKNKSVTSVVQDHEGGLWFSTLESGVYHVPNMMINHYELPTTTRIRGIVSLPGRLMIGDQGGNLLEVNTDSREVKKIRTLKSAVISIFNSGKRIFLSTGSDLQVYDQSFRFEKNYPMMMASDFSSDKAGKTWAFGGQKMGWFDENGKLLKLDRISQLYRSVHLQDTLFFMAERTGLHIRNDDLKLLKVHESFSDIKISNILGFNDSTLLITTIGKGFILMDSRNWTFKTFNTQNNFIADHIFSSLIDDKYLWLGTENGLVKIAIDQLDGPSLSFEYLTKKSGLISDKIEFLLRVNDRIWAFSGSNFSVIPESFAKFANDRPLFYIDDIQVNNTLKAASHLGDLGHKENTLNIAFGFISFNNQNILLRYRLSENDTWIYTNNKQLLFPSLSPGQYAFDLQYSSDNVKWLPAMAPLKFSIAEPWWGQWYTLVGAMLALLTFAFFYFRYQQSIYRQRNHYLRIINEHQQKLIQSEILTRERERNRISKELHDRVGTNLSAIKLTVSQLLKTHREPLADDVEEQFQVAIQEIKDIIYGLTPPGLERYGLFTGLKNYVGKLTRSIPINISLKTFGRDIHRYELTIIVFRVLQELLSNSIKHSFARNITIHLNSFDDMLNIVYEDDGVGFSYNPEQSGLGLDNIESRIRSINGTLKFESGNFGISYTIDIPITLNKEVA